MSLRAWSLSILLTACWPAGAHAAESLVFKHSSSIYEDGAKTALKFPEGVACTEKVLFVADTGNARLVKYSLDKELVSGGTAIKLAQFAQPTQLAIDAAGNLLVLDRKARRIGRLDAQGGFGGWVEPKGAGDVNAMFPVAFAVDTAGNLVILDAALRKVLVLDASLAVARQLPLPEGTFTDVTIDRSGTIYVMEPASAKIWSAEKSGSAFRALGSGLKDVAVFPAYLTTDQRATLIVVDQHGHGIVLVGVDGTYQGRQLKMGWVDGSLYYPGQVCLNASGIAFIADRNNSRVQEFSTGK